MSDPLQRAGGVSHVPGSKCQVCDRSVPHFLPLPPSPLPPPPGTSQKPGAGGAALFPAGDPTPCPTHRGTSGQQDYGPRFPDH